MQSEAIPSGAGGTARREAGGSSDLSRSDDAADLEVSKGQWPAIGDEPHPVVTRLFEDGPPDIQSHADTLAGFDADAVRFRLEDNGLVVTAVEGNDLDNKILVDHGSSQGRQLKGHCEWLVTDRKARRVYLIEETMQSDLAVIVHGIVGAE